MNVGRSSFLGTHRRRLTFLGFQKAKIRSCGSNNLTEAGMRRTLGVAVVALSLRMKVGVRKNALLLLVVGEPRS